MNLFLRTYGLSVLLASVVTLGIFCVPFSKVSASSGVKINDTNFPSEDFRNYILTNIDTDDVKGELSDNEIKKVKNINLNFCNLTDLKGIEYFTELENLDAFNARLKTVDLSKNTNLKTLNLFNNELTTLDLSNNKDLSVLSVGYNKIKSIDLSNNTKLKELTVQYNELSELDLSQNTVLERLTCENNSLKILDLTDKTSLVELNANSNSLTKLVLKGCKKLNSVSAYYNKLSTVDLSDLTELNRLMLQNNSICNLDLCNNKKLSYMSLGNNKLTKIDVSNNKELTRLVLRKNNLTELDVSQNSKLFDLEVEGNNISKLSIINNFELYTLNVAGIEHVDLTMIVGRSMSFMSAHGILTVDDEKIIEKDSNRTINAIKIGKTFITDDSGCKINVQVIAEPTPSPTATPTPEPTVVTAKLTLNKKTLNVVCGKTETIKAVLEGAKAKVRWHSSDTKIATIDSDGKITAKMAGSVTITATAVGKSATCKVTVLYKDVTNSKDFWYAPTNYLTGKEIVKGYIAQTEFRPANKCTRAQMVTFLWRLQGQPSPKSSVCRFTDVKKTDYFYKACIWGSEKHIVEGYKDGTFGPQIVCARKHAVTFLWRLAKKPEPETKTNKFIDIKTNDYFYKATLWASEKKILAGYSDGTFRPNGDCLRRQMVTFLYKYDKFVNGKG